MKGRKPTPAALKVLQGRLKKGSPEAKAHSSVPKDPLYAPKFLDRRGKGEWRRLKKQLQQLGLLTVLDMAAFASYCQWYSEYYRLNVYINNLVGEMGGENALLMTTPNGALMQNPLVTLRNQAYQNMKSALAELGLSPSSRARLVLAAPAAEDDDILDG